MKLAFVDETSDSKFSDYLGICVATIDTKYYNLLKTESVKILRRINWDERTEFKGSYLFSKSSGCSEVEVEKRVEAAKELLDLNVSSKNSRLRFHYCRQQSDDHGADYLMTTPLVIGEAIGKAPKGAGKKLLVVHCDERSDVGAKDLHDAIAPIASEKGWTIIENVAQVTSTFETVGLMYADLVGYLRGRIDNISSDSELFEGLTPEEFSENGKVRKLLSSTDLVAKIKSLDLYEVKRGE